MSQRKIDSTLRTKICNPVPGKNAFNADYNVFSKSIGHKFQIISGTFHVFVEYSFSVVVDDTEKLLATFMERIMAYGNFLCYNNFMNISNSSVTNLTDDKDFIRWDPKFALGIPIIDEQHKHLVELCNKLYTEVMESRAKYGNENNTKWQNTLVGTLKECVNYVTTHFSNEEKIMKVVGYERFSEHKNRHDEFTKKVLETAKGFNSMDFSDAIKFCKFLYEWILSHIAHEDKLYVKKVLEYKKINHD